MNKLFVLKLKVAASAALLLASILVFLNLNGTLAWFASNERVTGIIPSLSVATPDITGATITVHPVSLVEDDLYYYYKEDEEATELPRYDPSEISSTFVEKALVF